MPARQSLSSKKLGTGGRFTSMLGGKTKNSPTAGQNLRSYLAPPQSAERSITSQGAKVMGLGADTIQASGPGDPPVGFVGGTTSKSEWYLYWAFEKVLGPESNGKWDYQSSMLGGRSTRGGAVVDFVVNQEPIYIGVRLQSQRFHLEDNSYQKAHDREQMFSLTDWDFVVVDVYEDEFLDDPTGQAAIRTVLRIINRNQVIDPLSFG